jgi:hypothetical protein
MSALISQKNKGYIDTSAYIKHDKYGWKSVDRSELPEFIAQGWQELINPSWLYHKEHGPDIFCSTELEEVTHRGWVDSPAKLYEVNDEPKTEEALVSYADEEVKAANDAAKILLSGAGLNQKALMRALDIDDKKAKQRERFKPVYDTIFKVHSQKIKRLGMSWFWKEPPTPAKGKIRGKVKDAFPNPLVASLSK